LIGLFILTILVRYYTSKLVQLGGLFYCTSKQSTLVVGTEIVLRNAENRLQTGGAACSRLFSWLVLVPTSKTTNF
jgi:hypothetical protein